MHASSLWIFGSACAVATALVAGCGGTEFQGTTDDLTNAREGGAAGSAAGSSGGGGKTGSASGGSVGTGGTSSVGGSAGASGGVSSGGTAGASSGGAGGGVVALDGGGPGGAVGSVDGGTSSSGGTAGTGGALNTGGAIGCTTQTTFYPDNDKDGFGRSTGTVTACVPPPTGIWSTVGEDCDDDNESVFPGSAIYHDAPHSTSGGNHSFDYDCSNAEEGDPASPYGAAVSCAQLLVCKGAGYVPTTRTGAGVNALCGSTTLSKCVSNGLLGCTAVTSNTTTYKCK